jgi:uncharacterized membrane protein required for colicin V production
MNIVTVVAAIILFFSFVGGLMQGAVKSFFSLAAFIIAIPIAGRFYPFFANLLGFLPGSDWENFIGFFIILALATVVLTFVFYFPRQILGAVMGGVFFRLIGGLLNLLDAAVGLVMFTLLISTYPVWDWLQQEMVESSLIIWLLDNLEFVRALLPQIMRNPDIRFLLPLSIINPVS